MLTIYSASAGTGKTHTLTGEYLSLLFKGKNRHRNILAVTFTNKATAEMKSRIIEELFRLSNGLPSDYLEQLSDNGRITETEIRSLANKKLISLLHDYSAFNISTIDHFFQRTIRAFAREINLQGNYQLELDVEPILEEAVESLLSALEKNENPELLDWLVRFTEEKIEDGNSWDIRKDIKTLGEQLFKETYKAHSDDIQKDIKQKAFLTEYLDGLYKIISANKRRAKEKGEQGLLLMKQHGLHPKDFKGISKSPFFYFEKLANGTMKKPTDTFRGLVDNLDDYLSKTAGASFRQAVETLYSNGMNQLIGEVISFFDHLTDYYTAIEIKRSFYALGILTDLSQHLAKWREDYHKMLITDSTELLNKVIEGSEIPFIYEKTGTQIEHYMIDEFQDTSGMQWENFRPLLKDSLDSGRNNLIVGDIKQSIYRFRNADWTLLESKVKNDFQQRYVAKNLDVNWRSCRHIVELNNMLFQAIPTLLQNAYNEEIWQSSLTEEAKMLYASRMINAYDNAEQKVSKPLADKAGHVWFQFLTDDDDQKWKEKSLEQLPAIVEQLQEHGYELRDIAILTRKKHEGQQAAETLLNYKEAHPDSKYKYDIISEDSLKISSSLSVQWVVTMLRCSFQNIDSHYEQAKMMYAVLKLKKQVQSESSSHSFHEMSAINDYVQPFSPETIEQLTNLSNRPLYELTEGIFRLFADDFPANELVFMQAFMDMVEEYASNETADVNRFLSWWDEKGCKKAIATPDSQNAIRIMTIHKAKGLGFKAVILPFADWKIDQREAFLWRRPSQKPFDKISLVPLKYSKNLVQTIFAADYFDEKLHAYMDNLNTLYVALTRAKEELIVLAPTPKKTAKTTTIATLLWGGLQWDSTYMTDPESGVYERGTSWHTETNPSTTVAEELPMERFHSVSPDKRLLLRLHRKGGFMVDEKRKYGLLMHDVLSKIRTKDDVSSALSEMYAAGEINREDTGMLTEKLNALICQTPVKQWFEGTLLVMNEADILFGNGEARRPDRVMIDDNRSVTVVDYKFGELKKAFYSRQMEKYIALMREMGYQNVTGFIWYTTLNEVVKCDF